MIDLLNLRNILETALAEELGAYTFVTEAGTQTTGAIALDMGDGSYPIAGTRVDGLECVIIFRPEIPMKVLFGGYEETYSVQIVLKQWDAVRTTLPGLDKVLEALGEMPELSLQSGSVRRVLPLPKLGNIETVQLTVYQVFLTEFD
jgi:hypothetical protein